MERGESPTDGTVGVEMSTSMEKEKILNDDPKWNGQSVQHYTIQHHTKPCNAVLYLTTPYCTTPYCTTLYCTVYNAAISTTDTVNFIIAVT